MCMRSRTSTALLFLIATIAGGLPAGAQHATEIIDYSYSGHPDYVLGAPNNCETAVDFASVGAEAGYVTVGFGDTIYDGVGDDVLLVLTGFQAGQHFVEDFEFLASQDDTTFVSLGYRNPNEFNYAPNDVVTFGFDLMDGGLNSASSIKVLNRQIVIGTNSEGPDICGFEAPSLARDLYTCLGFEAPMDSGPVTVKRSRALPLKAVLLDSGVELTALDLPAPPVLQVNFAGLNSTTAVDVTDEAVPVGQGTEGNQFVYNEGLWRYNLRTDNYTSPGTYTVILTSGDSEEYGIDGCTAKFVILP